jgi:hypothetical protein
MWASTGSTVLHYRQFLEFCSLVNCPPNPAVLYFSNETVEYYEAVSQFYELNVLRCWVRTQSFGMPLQFE